MTDNQAASDAVSYFSRYVYDVTHGQRLPASTAMRRMLANPVFRARFDPLPYERRIAFLMTQVGNRAREARGRHREQARELVRRCRRDECEGESMAGMI